MSTSPLKAITLTHVRYTRADQIGHLLGWVSLVPVFISLGGLANNWLVEGIAWALAVLTLISRVYLGYHSIVQVCSGAILGTLLGAVWYWVVNNVLIGYFPMIEEGELGRRFYIKDTSHILNVLKFEYDNAGAARKTAAAKVN